MIEFSVLIPFHNEEKNLKPLLAGLKKALLALRPGLRWEVLFIDDASTDSGFDKATTLLVGEKNFYLYRLKKRGGQTEAFRLAFRKARGRYFLRMDADLQDNPEYIPRFVEKMREGYDMIMGVRINRKHNAVLLGLTKAYDTVVSHCFSTGLATNSGSFIAFRAEFLKEVHMKKNDHRYLPLIAIRRGARKNISLPIPHRRRVHGVTKYPTLKKVCFGFFEMILFYRRLLAGYYDSPISNLRMRGPR